MAPPGGVRVAIPSRAFDVLLYLVEHRARVVAKHDLIDAVWPGAAVEENNLSQAISTLRRALGDSTDAPRFIVTVPGRGFQFVADVRVASAAPAAGREPARRPTHDETAWRLYLSGRCHWDRKSPDGIRLAIELYRAAIERDAQFALPHAGLADALALLGVFAIQPARAVLPEARRLAERAVELDDRLAEAHASLGHVTTQYGRDWDEGQRCYERSIALKPGYGQAWMWLAMSSAYRGRHALAREQIRHAQSLEPMSLSFSAIAGMLMYLARNFDEAHAHLRPIVETVPEAPLPRHLHARVLLALGEAAQAVAMLEGDTSHAPFCLSNLGCAYALDGRGDDARREIARVQALGERGFAVGYDLAQIHCALGEHDAALAALERGVVDSSQTIGYLNSEVIVDAIRDHPRFRAVSRRLGLG